MEQHTRGGYLLLYHNTSANYTELLDRPTFFWDSEILVRDMSSAWAGSINLVVVAGKQLVLASIDQAAYFANQIWPDSELIYSMFDVRVNEFPVDEISMFISLFVDAGYDGVYIDDYHPADHCKNATSILIFSPVRSKLVIDRILA